MSPGSVLVYIAQETSLRRGYTARYAGDATFLELYSRLLTSKEKCPSEIADTLEQRIRLTWEDVYDYVNPFGDRRGGAFDSVWTFDLKNDVIVLLKKDTAYSTSLNFVRAGLLTLEDFKSFELPVPAFKSEQNTPEPYWEPIPFPCLRERAFIGQLLRDFGYTWRHVLRRPPICIGIP